MKRIVPAAVFLLMVSVGMSLRPRDVVAELRRMEWQHGAGLVPQRSCRRRWRACFRGRGAGSVDDAEYLAAGYQLWAGLLTPIVLQGLLTWWLSLAVMLLALGSVLAISLLAAERRAVGETYAGDLQCESACAVGRAAERTAGGSGGRRREAWVNSIGRHQVARAPGYKIVVAASWNCVD